MITTVLFDLDGTLLPMDNEEFIRVYFGLLGKRFAALGYDPQELAKAVWTGTTMMIKNNGVLTNEEVFWNKFQEIVGERALKDRDIFDEFYVTDFKKAKSVCGYDEELVRLVADLKTSGYRIALATNPIFPVIATESRIRWAGFEPSDFELYTTYENIGFCKPNPEYYREILRRLDVPAEECIMIGNDAIEDTAAQEVGIGVYLLTDNLLNKENRDISAYPHGGADGIRKLLLK